MLALADTSAGGAEGTRPSAAVAAAFADPLTTTAALADYLFPPGDPAEIHRWEVRERAQQLANRGAGTTDNHRTRHA